MIFRTSQVEYRIAGLLLFGAFLVAACGGDSSAPAAPAGNACKDTVPTATLSSIRTEVFEKSCAISASCHEGDGNLGKLNLSKSRVEADLRTDLLKASEIDGAVKRVVPGNPDASILQIKLASPISKTAPCITDGNKAGCGQVMPETGGTLCDGKVKAIRDWITAGAP